MEARIAGALVDVDGAVIAVESGQTDARMIADAVDALGAVETGRRAAVVDVDVAVGPAESCSTQTVVSVEQIRARAVVGARPALALVHVHTLSRRS